jgi:hypothetical protein
LAVFTAPRNTIPKPSDAAAVALAFVLDQVKVWLFAWFKMA